MPSPSPGWGAGPTSPRPPSHRCCPQPPLISRLNPDGDLSAKTILDVILYIIFCSWGLLRLGVEAALWAFAPSCLSKRPYSISQYLYPCVGVTASSWNIPPTTPPRPPGPQEEGKMPGRGKVRSGSGEVGFESAHFHIICILSCPLPVRCFLYSVIQSHRHIFGGWAS